jgi:hypothetical protein
MYRYTLERYSGGRSRYICPSCGQAKKFTRYIDLETGDYFADHVGRCNREVKCGYHFTPREFFADTPSFNGEKRASKANQQREAIIHSRKPTPVSFISARVLKQTLGTYERNNFVKFLLARFPSARVKRVVYQYLIGTWADGRTVFWQIDFRGRIRTGKLIAYDLATGKRLKERKPSWVHAELKSADALCANFKLEQCFFGEHLLPREPGKVIGLVESEKTAIVARLFIPEFIWLATGGCGNLNLTRLRRAMKGRRVVLFPDSSKFKAWSNKSDEARSIFGQDVRVSDLLERRLTGKQKREDYDIADFLLVEGTGQTT